MSHELYKRYRPKSFKGLIGQEEAVRLLQGWHTSNRIPHSILLTGSSGCGKTTIGRILKTKLCCSDHDFLEINGADSNGINDIRAIGLRMGLSPLGGKCRIYLIDEAHQITKDAQDALLKMMEDTPKHVYFILATTDPQKLKLTIRNRCSEVRVRDLTREELEALVKRVLEAEEKSLSADVIARIAEVAEGSARKALVELDKVIDFEKESEQLECLKNHTKHVAVEIAQALLNTRGQTTWPQMAKILRGVEEDPESLRHMILGYCTSVMLGSADRGPGKLAPRAALVINYFRDNFYDSKRAGLVEACYAVIHKA